MKSKSPNKSLINISIRDGGTGIGIKSMINETINIGKASRKINKRESDLIDKKNIIETAMNNEYELTRFLYMYTIDTPKKQAQDFIDYILS